ncbi:MAG: hypothetical protein LBH38_03840, partial [Holosporales bacterium]|nr:hypothetical protein [Holosporales bacterium]
MLQLEKMLTKRRIFLGSIACILCLILYKGSEEKNTEPLKEAVLPAQVLARLLQAQMHETEIILRGTAVSWRKVTLCSRTSGTVTEILADRGVSVQKADPIVVLSSDDRQEK